ncbi:nicotinate phosphoribosyltransferase [Bizionia sediminis]|uniref:Nicotinate phosphoribosyltransferase n=1 Tax=Bizionia sediminis TaxID=1737064 RepID=A0ABW5KT20_9FLAO
MTITAAYTDLYQLTMAQVYFKTKPDGHAVFDYYYRNNPFKGGYGIFAGLEDILNILENLHFTSSDITYLEQHGFELEFLNYLKTFRFNGNIYACAEGDVVFPNRPILQVEANIIEAQIIETCLLNILNFQTLIATKASRIKHVAKNSLLLDMGFRRAHATGAYYATRAAAIGGFNSTSNVKAAADYNIPCSGTMAHAFIQSYDNELQAFRDFARWRPNKCVLLIDTYNTLKSGLPNAITVAKEMEARGQQLFAVRLDSGDLAYLAKQTRQILDAANLQYVQIVASNQLDEFVIKSIKEQAAPIDIFGVGTNLVTGKPDAALDGVYKLTEFNGEPRIKLSENQVKVTLPHKKQVFRLVDDQNMFYGADAITLHSETTISEMVHPFDPAKRLQIGSCNLEPLLQPVMLNGRKTKPPMSVADIANYSAARLAQLPEEFKRFQNPHQYKIGLSTQLKESRDYLMTKHK